MKQRANIWLCMALFNAWKLSIVTDLTILAVCHGARNAQTELWEDQGWQLSAVNSTEESMCLLAYTDRIRSFSIEWISCYWTTDTCTRFAHLIRHTDHNLASLTTVSARPQTGLLATCFPKPVQHIWQPFILTYASVGGAPEAYSVCACVSRACFSATAKR